MPETTTGRINHGVLYKFCVVFNLDELVCDLTLLCSSQHVNSERFNYQHKD